MKAKILEGTIRVFNQKGLKFTMDDVARELGMSKNAFKRAVGRLYKERRIIINDNSIRKIK